MNTFEQNLLSFFNRLGNAKKMVLATSKDNHVSARMMSCIIIDRAIYFQTDKKSLKYEQIKSNPNIALSIDNIQIEGTTIECGHPMTDENSFFAYEYQKHYKNAFDLYSSIPSETLFKVVLTKITLWEYSDGKPVCVFFDLEKKQYLSKPYFA